MSNHITSGVNSTESKRKHRRWEFQAHVDYGQGPQVLKLQRLVIGTSRTALDICQEQEEMLRQDVAALKDAEIRIEAIAKETISPEIQRQLQAHSDLSEILHLALSLASEDILRKEKGLIVTPGGSTSVILEQKDIDTRSGEYYLNAANTLREARRRASLGITDQGREGGEDSSNVLGEQRG